MRKPLSIALLGTRGIPARYGGFETFAEELSTRLVARGHKVSVFCRSYLGNQVAEKPAMFRGVDLAYSSTVKHKYLETPVHAFTSNCSLIGTKFDVALLCNAANSPFAWMIRLLGIPLCINVDGIERERAKWNAVGRLWYRLGELASVWFAHRVIGDAQVISDYYKEHYGCETTMIPYGASASLREPGSVLQHFRLEVKRYILYVSRLEPENNALGVIEAYKHASLAIPLVIVGDAPYAEAYKQQLRASAANDPRIIFTGYQFGEAYQELQSHCTLYIQATEVGGTHPALIESMAYGNCIIANGTPENHEVLGDAGVFYPKNDFQGLAEQLKMLLSEESLLREYRARAAKRAAEKYTWDAVTDAYEALFYSLATDS